MDRQGQQLLSEEANGRSLFTSKFFISLLFVLNVLVLHNIEDDFLSRYAISLSILTAISFAFIWKKNLIALSQKKSFKYLIFLLFTVILSTIWNVFFNHKEFNFYQLIRSQAWTLLLPLYLGVSFNVALNYSRDKRKKVIDIIGFLVSLIAVGSLIKVFLDVTTIPSYINIDSSDGQSERMYSFLSELALPFIPIFFYKRKFISLISAFIILTLTQGKVEIVLMIFSILFLISFIKISIIKKIIIISLLVITSLLAYKFVEERFIFYIENGDTNRALQIEDAVISLNKDPISLFFGIGLGTSYSDRYQRFGGELTENRDRVIENARFDIENGYYYLLLRLGIVGSIIFIYLIFFRFGSYNFYFWPSLLIIWLGGSSVGASSVILFCGFGLAAGIYNNKL